MIGGRNARLQRIVREAAKAYPYDTRILGFVDNVVDYMLASDVLLTKPGGLTTSEALSAELPMILVPRCRVRKSATPATSRGAAPRCGPLKAATSRLPFPPCFTTPRVPHACGRRRLACACPMPLRRSPIESTGSRRVR